MCVISALAGGLGALQPAYAADSALDISLTTYFAAFGLVALAIAGVMFAVGIAQRARQREAQLRLELAQSQRSASEKSALLLSPDSPLYLFAPGQSRPRMLGPDTNRLERALRGPDGPALAEAIKALRASGEPFAMPVRDETGVALRARGRAAGRETAVFLESADDLPQPSVRAAPQAHADGSASALNALGLPVAARDSEGRLVFANDAYAQAVDATDPQDALTRQLSLSPAEPGLAAAALAQGRVLAERRYAVIGGQRRALDLTAMPAGHQAVIHAVDVSALADAEAKLARHMAAHDETLNRIRMAVAVFGKDQTLAFFNTAFAELFRIDPAWLSTHPDEASVYDRMRQNRRLPEEKNFGDFKKARGRLFATLTETQEELWHLPDGSALRVLAQPYPLGGLLYLYDDITDRLSLESRFNTLNNVQRSTLDHLHEGVAFFGTDGRLKLWNTAFADLWGLEPDQLSGEPHFDVVAALCQSAGGEPEAWDQMRNQITGATERREETGELNRSDEVVLRYAAVPMPDGATLLSFLDLTDSVRAEESLIQKNEALQEVGRVKTDFVSHVSYQLLVPLTTVRGFAEAMKMGIVGEVNPKQELYLRLILEAADMLKMQIENMIDLAALDAEELSLELKSFNITDFMKNLRSMVQERCNRSNLTLEMQAEDTLGDMTADPVRLKQVMFNLLSNAIAYTPPGGKISFGCVPEGAGLCFWVKDTGPGLDPDMKARAFERFASKRVGSARRGTGLGLPLVQAIIELHGGWATLNSREGEGTHVLCHMPRSAEAPALPDLGPDSGPEAGA